MRRLELSVNKLISTPLIIIAIGSFFRLYQLGLESIWFDEGYTIRVSQMSLQGILHNQIANDFNPPVYYAIIHYWINLFGNSEVSVRLISAAASIVSIYLIYKVASLLFDRHVGLISAVLFSIEPFMLYYAQEARSYSLMVMFTLASFYFLIRILKNDSKADYIGYVVSSILLIYMHYYGLFTVVAQNVFIVVVFLLSRQGSNPVQIALSVKRWIVSQLAITISFVPWFSILITQKDRLLTEGSEAGWTRIPTAQLLQDVWSALTQYAGTTYAFVVFILVCFGALIFRGMFSVEYKPFVIWRKRLALVKNPDYHLSAETILLLSWLITPMLLAFILCHLGAFLLASRYLLGVAPALYILTAQAINSLNNRKLSIAALVLVIALILPSLWTYYGSIQKEQWREASAYIESHTRENGLVVFCPGNVISSLYDYYATGSDYDKKGFPLRKTLVDEDTIKDLDKITNKRDSIVVMTYFIYDNHNLIYEHLKRDYDLVDYKTFIGQINVFTYERR